MERATIIFSVQGCSVKFGTSCANTERPPHPVVPMNSLKTVQANMILHI